MADSRRKLILDAVVTQLNTITVANGYNTDLGITGGAQKLKVNSNQIGTLPVALVSMFSEDKEEDRVEFVEGTLRFAIAIWPDVAEGDNAEDILEDLILDIERAILTKMEEDPPWGVPGCLRIARDGVVGHIKNTPEGDVSAEIELVIGYRHDTLDPSTFGGSA